MELRNKFVQGNYVVKVYLALQMIWRIEKAGRLQILVGGKETDTWSSGRNQILERQLQEGVLGKDSIKCQLLLRPHKNKIKIASIFRRVNGED